MKKIVFLSFFSIVTSVAAFAISGPGTPEKIKEVFSQNFPEIKNPVFFNLGTSYTVFFKKDSTVSEKVHLNSDGEITETIKYYKAEELDLLIRGKINKKYKGKTIFGISEMQSNSEHFYKVALQDDENWFIVQFDGTGSVVSEMKYHKK